jgi:hypothetical protein
MQEFDRYKEIRNRVNQSIKDLKEGYWEKFISDMEYNLHGGQKRIWKMLQKDDNK